MSATRSSQTCRGPSIWREPTGTSVAAPWPVSARRRCAPPHCPVRPFAPPCDMRPARLRHAPRCGRQPHPSASPHPTARDSRVDRSQHQKVTPPLPPHHPRRTQSNRKPRAGAQPRNSTRTCRNVSLRRPQETWREWPTGVRSYTASPVPQGSRHKQLPSSAAAGPWSPRPARHGRAGIT